MTAVVTLPPGAQLCHLPSPFPLARGGSLAAASIAYQRIGPAGAPVVVALGGISADRHVASSGQHRGWWGEVVGERLGIDTARYAVLSFDWLGGVGGSSAPGSGESFPFVAAEDQARALWSLCDVLGIARVHAIVGCSYGGMVAMHAAAQQPARCARLVAIAAAHRSHPQASAWRQIQRRIVALGSAGSDPRAAVALARSLAMTTYRSPGELGERFVGGDDDASLHGWLNARGEAFASEWNPERFLCLNRSIDAHRIDPVRVAVPTSLLAFDSDQLVPARDVRELALGLPRLHRHREIASRYGHDGFLKEPRHVSSFLREVLQ